ncbi:MAG: 4Fe-4S binding protein [Nanoarchaeota archaeon]|nr:4Fe-4S binding protein [Nanoarchaeota archaeon]
MTKRKIVEIDEKKCNGCGLCIPNCHEGALQIIDGKARLISDLFCDGLGNCLGHCPKGAIKIVEKEAEPYDETKVMEKISKQGANTIKAHLMHLKDHNETKLFDEAVAYLKKKKIKIPKLEDEKMEHSGCPGSMLRTIQKENTKNAKSSKSIKASEQESELRQWPVQLNLLPAHAPIFDNKHLLVAADCTAFACANFHSKLLAGKIIVIGCPKLDNTEEYEEKLTEIFKNNKVKSVTVAIMEVPCCGGLLTATESAIAASGKKIPLIQETISINGEIM